MSKRVANKKSARKGRTWARQRVRYGWRKKLAFQLEQIRELARAGVEVTS